jgi:tRNA nucleotidyltransferase (CCA-adding enzyme)
VEELDLIAAIDAKPLLDVGAPLRCSSRLLIVQQGREVVRILEAPKPGPWTGMVLARVIEWQLEHPAGSKEECAEWLKAERAAGRIVVEDAGAPATKRGKGGAGESAAKKAKR